MNLIRFLSIMSLVGILPGVVALGQNRAPDRPQPSLIQGWAKLVSYQSQQLMAKPADICFVGDSLTEFWTVTGKATWELEFQGIRAVNFGIAADRSENILYRLTQVNLARTPPRSFVLLAGTNNLSNEPPDTPEKTASAIKTIVDYLVKQCPKSRVFLLTLPPNGYESNTPLRERVVETNRCLKELTLPEQATLIDIYSTFADDTHHWKPGMTLDGTHFSEQGYDHLARVLKPALDALRSDLKSK